MQTETLWLLEPAQRQAALFGLLTAACRDRHSPLHTLSLATVAVDGSPELRTVVFRGFDAAGRECRMHTDVRSPKVAALRRDPRAVLLWYAPAWKLQVRASAQVRAHHADEVARRYWEETHVRGRRAYCAPLAPGTVSTEAVSDLAPHLETEAATEANTTEGYAHFAVLLARFDTLEWLTLSSAGNRRGRYCWSGEGWRHEWLAP